MIARRPSSLVALVPALAAAVIAYRSPGLAEGLAFLAPALAAFAVLALGRYPGELRLLGPVRRAPRRPCARTPVARPSRRRRPRGGLLLASALAGRGPPGGR